MENRNVCFIILFLGKRNHFGHVYRARNKITALKSNICRTRAVSKPFQIFPNKTFRQFPGVDFHSFTRQNRVWKLGLYHEFCARFFLPNSVQNIQTRVFKKTKKKKRVGGAHHHHHHYTRLKGFSRNCSTDIGRPLALLTRSVIAVITFRCRRLINRPRLPTGSRILLVFFRFFFS